MKKAALLCIMLGLILIATPFVGSKLIERQQNKLLTQIDSQNEELDSAISVIKQVPNLEPSSAIGEIRIPCIRLDLPILYGVDETSLKKGIGYLENSDPFGEGGGNAVLAGHRNYVFGKMFSRLDEVKIGDAIEIRIGNTTFTYRVFQKRIVLPDDLSVLEDVEGKSVVTLITCTPIGNSTHRRIVQGELK